MKLTIALLAVASFALLFGSEARACSTPDPTLTLQGSGDPLAVAAPCPPLNCPTVCGVQNQNQPFERLMPENPTLTDGCFGLTKKTTPSGPFYVAFVGFRRYTSIDGLTWTDTGQANGIPEAGTEGALCPDPHWVSQGGRMYMYYAATQGGKWKFFLAESGDGGLNWVPKGAVFEELDDPANYFVYMPSVVEYQGWFYLAYARGRLCEGVGLNLSTIHVRRSPDKDGPWSVVGDDPVLRTGPMCASWDDGSVNRPRLWVDPTGTKLHLFYTGYGVIGTTIQTRCCKIGHSYSCDGGFSFTKNPNNPVLDIPYTPPTNPPPPVLKHWDEGSFLVPCLTWEQSSSILRMYYRAKGHNTNGQPITGIGVAEADWQSNFGNLCPITERDPGSGSPFDLRHSPQAPRAEASESPLTIFTHPEPTTGRTMIDFSWQGSVDAEIEIAIIDLGGRLIRHLWSGPASALPNQIEFNGRSDGETEVPVGRYLIRATSGQQTVGTVWMTLVH